jgi:hypothetical protein
MHAPNASNLKPPAGVGELEFVSYMSSPFEQLFIEKLPLMNFPDHEEVKKELDALGDLTFESMKLQFYLKEYCAFVDKYRKQIDHWLAKVKVRACMPL